MAQVAQIRRIITAWPASPPQALLPAGNVAEELLTEVERLPPADQVCCVLRHHAPLWMWQHQQDI